MMANDRLVLRFLARLDTTAPEDAGRIFVIKYFLADDTVAVFEPPQKNSGVIGGKFLERSKLKKADGNDYFTQADFFTGAVVRFNSWTFVIYQADEYSLSYMESEPSAHPMSDVGYIADQLAPVLKEKKADLEAKFAAMDPAGSGSISYEALQEILSGAMIELNDQVLITLMRRFDINKEGIVDYKRLMAMA